METQLENYMTVLKFTFVVALSIFSIAAFAKGGHSSHSSSPGTGAASSKSHVSGYTKKDGTYVAPHDRSTADKKFENNWTTKGNTNPNTGTDGTLVVKPTKK
jgi:hypothetical protein